MNAKMTSLVAGIALLAGVGIANAEERLTAAAMDGVTAAGGYDSLHVWHQNRLRRRHGCLPGTSRMQRLTLTAPVTASPQTSTCTYSGTNSGESHSSSISATN